MNVCVYKERQRQKQEETKKWQIEFSFRLLGPDEMLSSKVGQYIIKKE